MKIKSYLVTVDIDKAFDSLDHSFLISVIKEFGFPGKISLIGWKKKLYKQELWIVDSGLTTKYFNVTVFI